MIKGRGERMGEWIWRMCNMAGKLDGRRGVKRPLTKGCQFNHNNRSKISCFYTNARSFRNKYAELNAYVSLDKLDIIFYNGDMGKNFCTE